MLGNFHAFECRLLTFFIINFSKKSLTNTIRVTNTLNPDQDRWNVGLDLDPKLISKVISRPQKLPLARKKLNGLFVTPSVHLLE